jgi:glutamate 5-kinase
MRKISEKKRIVIKLGSSTLTHKTGKLNIRRMTNLTRIISDLHNSGKEIILVSSGSVAMGFGKLNLPEKPKETSKKQAAAAVGQCELMRVYDDMFEKYSVTVAQILVTKKIIENGNLVNVQNTIESLLDFGCIPIVNENDTVAIDELELEIGENDSLSAVIAQVANADLLVILSDINGLYTSDPRKDPEAKPIYTVTDINHKIEAMAGGSGTALGTGGMATKINAAKIATESGIDMIIMNGRNPDLLYDLFDDKEDTGTLFVAKKTNISEVN